MILKKWENPKKNKIISKKKFFTKKVNRLPQLVIRYSQKICESKKNRTFNQKKKFFTKKVNHLYKFVIRFYQKNM